MRPTTQHDTLGNPLFNLGTHGVILNTLKHYMKHQKWLKIALQEACIKIIP